MSKSEILVSDIHIQTVNNYIVASSSDLIYSSIAVFVTVLRRSVISIDSPNLVDGLSSLSPGITSALNGTGARTSSGLILMCVLVDCNNNKSYAHRFLLDLCQLHYSRTYWNL